MLAQTVRESRRDPIEIRVTPSIARIFIALRQGATGPGFAAAMSRLYREQPEAAYFDKLYDLTDYRGVVTHADMVIIVEAYLKANSDPLHPCRTAFVTHDPNFGLWATAMSLLFVGREHRPFSTFQAAQAFLDEPMSERAAFVAK